MDLRVRRFWTALGARLLRASYYRGGVTAVFDTSLVAQTPVGIRLSLFFDDQFKVLSPTPSDLAYWEFHAQHILARASELGREGPIPSDLRRIREALGGRPPRGPLANQQLLFTEHTKPVPQWPEARYSVRLSLSIPKSQLTPQTLLNEVDDLTQFLIEAARSMSGRAEAASMSTSNAG